MQNKPKTPEEYRKQVIEANGDRFELLSEYHTNYRCRIQFRCTACGFVDNARSDVLQKGRECKNCLKTKYRKQYTKTTEQYKLEVTERTNGEYELSSEYTGVKNYIYVTHHDCGCTFRTTPHQFNRGRRCPNCNKSKGEVLVKQVLDTLPLVYKEQVTLNELPGLAYRFSYDFYVPEYKLLIEYQGVQHYRPVELFGGDVTFEKQLANDKYKRDFANSFGYHLLEIPYTEDTFLKVKNYINKCVNKIN